MSAFTDWLQSDRDINRTQFRGFNDGRQDRLRTAFGSVTPTDPASTPTTNTLTAWQQQFMQDEPRGYFDNMMSGMGLNTFGGDPFAEWMNTAGYERALGGFTAARYNNENLTFQDYLTSLGGVDYFKNLYADDYANANPEATWNKDLTGKGFNMARGDAMANYMNTTAYDNAHTTFEGLQGNADYAASTGWNDYLGGVSRDSLIHDYKAAPMDAKGLSYAPYEGFTRWMAFALALFMAVGVLLAAFGKVDARELPEKFFGGDVVSQSSLYWGSEAPEGTALSVDANRGVPLPAISSPRDPAIAGLVVGAHALVGLVGASRRDTKVSPSVVQTIPVDVIDLGRTSNGQAHDIAMHHDALPINHTIGIALRMHRPVERTDSLFVLDVDEGELSSEVSLAQRNENRDRIIGHGDSNRSAAPPAEPLSAGVPLARNSTKTGVTTPSWGF